MTIGEIFRLPLRLIPSGRVVPILSGALRKGRWVTGASPHGCWLGTYERLTQRLFQKHVRPGAIVFDIGANAGFFTLLAARLAGPGGHVFAFEPVPDNLALLREHVRLNQATNVTVLPLAVAASTGSARFLIGENPSQGELSTNGEIEVAVDSLDRLVGSGELPRPDFIKIDIEGGEDNALAGAAEVLKSPRITLLLSTHGWQHHEHCWTFLNGLGFELVLAVDGSADGNYLVVATRR
jgi:FkbM family methyltransferase